MRSAECACLPVGREWGWAVLSWSHEKRHDAKYPKHHVVDRSRHRISACKILTDRETPKPEECSLGSNLQNLISSKRMRPFINFLSTAVLKCLLVTSKIFLSYLHVSQPIPFLAGTCTHTLPPQIRLTGQIDMTIIVIKKERIMKTAAVSELKARLSEYLNQVKAGMEILITDRGKPVARLVPVSRNKDLKESLVRMEKQGLIRLGPGKLPKDFWKIPRPEDPKGLVLKALLEEREAGR